MEIKIGDGKNTHFWKDKWIEGELLKDVYSELYKVEEEKDCKVSDRVYGATNGRDHDLVWNWKRGLRRGIESTTLHELKNKINNVRLINASDTWRWSNNKYGTFSFTLSECR